MPFPFPFTLFGANRQSAGLDNTYSMEFGDIDGTAPGSSRTTNSNQHATGGNIFDFDGQSGFSISFWMKWNSTAGATNIINFLLTKNTGASPAYRGYQIYILGNVVHFTATNDFSAGRFWDIKTDSAIITNNQWHHVVCVFNGTDNAPNIYVDNTDRGLAIHSGGLFASGNQIDTGASVDFLLASRDDIVDAGGNTLRYAGLLDEIAIFNTNLDADAVATIYNSGVPGDLTGTSNLQSWWRMGDDSSDNLANNGQITDQVGSNNLTPKNTASGNRVADVPS